MFVYRRLISSEGCTETHEDQIAAWKIDYIRGKFIVRKKFRMIIGSRRLGFLWLILDPLILSLIYLFVFTVIRHNPNAASVFIGITLVRGLQQSLSSGSSMDLDFTGGLNIERVRTRAIIISEIMYLLANSFFLSFGTAIILIFLGVSYFGVIAFMLIAVLTNIFWYTIGRVIAPLTIRLPDMKTLIRYFGMAMFFMSPALYPLSSTTGLHRTFSLYNPFSFGAELSRNLALGMDGYYLLNPNVGVIYLITMVIFLYHSLYRLDMIRWRFSTWS